MASLTFEELFDPHFLEELRRLRLVAGRVPAGGRFAEQRSKAKGHGIEFRDFRPYAPGDDLRAVDWNIYRRLGRVFLRLFEELEDLPVYLLPDRSASAFLPRAHGAPRALAGLRTALALGAVALGQHDSVGVFPFDEDVEPLMRPQAGSDRTATLAKALARAVPPEAEAAARGPRGTDLARTLQRFGSMGLRSGLVVVISDFFDPAGLDAVTRALARLRHRLLLVQLVAREDRDPALADLDGDLRLVDCETGEAADLSLTPEVLARYRAALDAFDAGLADYANRSRAGLLRLDVDEPVVPQLAQLFEGGRYQA